MTEKTKKAAAKKPAKKQNPLEALEAAVEAARKAGAQVHATIAWTDDNGNVDERSF